MKGWAHTMSSLSMFSQLGLSLAAPLLLCVLICSWLTGRFGIGTWIYIPGFFFGLGGSGGMRMAQIQPAVKKETARVTGITLTGCVIMFAAFFVLHKISPASVPFDMKVIISGLLGSGVAVANFFFMGLTIQKIVSGEDEEQARKDMKASYRFRTVTQLLWVVLAVALPFLNGAAGLIPLFFPSAGIKVLSMFGMINAKPNP